MIGEEAMDAFTQRFQRLEEGAFSDFLDDG